MTPAARESRGHGPGSLSTSFSFAGPGVTGLSGNSLQKSTLFTTAATTTVTEEP